MRPLLPFWLLISLLGLATGYDVNLEVDGALPKLCFTSEDIVPKYVNAICHHRGKTYVGGFFNRVGNATAQHFVVFDDSYRVEGTTISTDKLTGEETVSLGTLVGIETTLERILGSGIAPSSTTNSSYLGLLTALACPAESDTIYLGGVFKTVTDVEPVTGKVREQIANNIIAYNTTAKTFTPIRAPDPAFNDTHIGLSSTCLNSPQAGPDCNDADQVAMVRTLECADAKCATLFVGGYFDTAFGVQARGLVRLDLTKFAAPEVTPVGELDGLGVDGLVMTVEALSPTEIVYGGIYDDPSDSDVPYLINRWSESRGSRCVLNRNMLDQSVCVAVDVASPPLLCCELVFGPVYATLRISTEDMLIGGEFVNTFDLSPDASTDFSNWFQLGYQNVAIVPATEARESTSDFESHSLVGGPDGDVRTLTCGETVTYDDDTFRCTVIYLGGSFNNWMQYFLDPKTLAITKTIRFTTPQHMAKLVWSDTDKLYAPQSVFVDPALSPVFDEAIDISVNTILVDEEAGEMLYGGEFPSQNNIGHFRLASSPSGEAQLNFPNEVYAPTEPDSEFYDCQTANGANMLSGANFCCRRGSYCPGGLVDISCPDGWGFLCKSYEINICPEGSYCPSAGEEFKCSEGHVCKLGSIKERKCEFWELCGEKGMGRPNRISGLFLGVMVLGSMFFLLIALVRVFSWRRRAGNRDMDKNFHLRYNAFKRNLTGANERGRRSSAFEGIVGHPENSQSTETESISMEDVVAEGSASFVINPTHLDVKEMDDMSVDTSSSRAKRELKIDISFKDLGVELVDGKKILQGVTGTLKAGRMTAIMGPSGCGKSTFLSALTNRIKDGGKVIGDVKINGEAISLLNIQHLVGFVPQEDIMHRDLSVRENLRFYAHLKGNPSMTRPQRRAFVNEIVDILGLSHVQHSLIGDEETRGISGGQRKRVNIGIELMASPLVLFLDEPTSGLDSTTTQQLIDSLDKLAKLGLTIAMVIHQPRYEVLLKIDDLLLLQKGGYPVYAGPTVEALSYFTGFLGSPCPDKTTPADHFLDVISANPQLAHGNVVDSWRWYVLNVIGERNAIIHPDEYADRVIPARARPSRFYQAYSFAKRSFYQTMNTKVAFFTDCCLLVFAGGMVGAVSLVEIQGYQLTMMVTGLIAVVSSLKVFGPERVVFARETSAGISTSAYFFGKLLAHLWQIALAPLFYLGMFYRTAYPTVEFWAMYRIILANQFSCSGLGYLISASVAPKNMQIAGVVSGLVSVLLSGLNPSARSLNSFLVGKIGLWCSYGSWTMGSLLIKQSMNSPLSIYPILVGGLDELGYLDVNNSTLTSETAIAESKVLLEDRYSENISFMFKQYAAYSILAYFIMSGKSRKSSGIFGLAAMKYLWRVDFVEPCVALLTTGGWETEDLSRREREERVSRLRARSDKSLMASRHGLSSASSATRASSPANRLAAMKADRSMNYSDDSEGGASDATSATSKSIMWVDSKDAPAINEATVSEDNCIREAESFKALSKNVPGGKKEAERLVREKLVSLQKYDNLGSVSEQLSIEQVFEVVKAAVRNRSPTREKK